MYRHASRFIAVCLFVVLGLQAPVGWAQQDENAFQLDPLIVTATRSAERLSRTTRSVTVISAEDMAAQGVQTVADALRSVPGLDVLRTGSLGATTSIFTRGSESDHTAVLIDGVKVNVLLDGKFDMADLSVDNVERIEVVRGPASTLYGSTATGGVIHIITKRGSGPLSANLNVSGGSFNTHAHRATVSGGTTWGGLSVSASRVESDGHLAFNNQYDNANVALRADLSPDERTNVDLTLRYIDSEYHFPTDGAGRVVFHNKYQTTHETALGLRGARALLPGWNSSLQFGLHQRKRRSYPESPGEVIFVTSEKRLSIDWQSVLDFRLGNVTLGAAHEDDEDTENDFRRHNTAGYAQLRVKLLEPVVLVGGLRVDEHSTFGTELTYQVSAAYFLSGGTKLRAALGTGFREPLWGELFSTLWTVGNPDLDPERSLTWELGVEQRLWEDRLRLEGVFFSSRFTDLIEYNSSPPEGQSNFFNVEEARTHGLEFSARSRRCRPGPLAPSIPGCAARSPTPVPAPSDFSRRVNPCIAGRSTRCGFSAGTRTGASTGESTCIISASVLTLIGPLGRPSVWTTRRTPRWTWPSATSSSKLNSERWNCSGAWKTSSMRTTRKCTALRRPALRRSAVSE